MLDDNRLNCADLGVQNLRTQWKANVTFEIVANAALCVIHITLKL